MTKKRLVAIFAHPDDEVMGTGGTLTKYADEGVETHLIVATRGEAGQVTGDDSVEPTQPMSLLRERELRRACECFGIKHLHLLGYMDGQTALVPPSEAVFKIVQLLRQIQPQVVLTFGPDGGYGHFDHLVVHRWSTAAVKLAADETRWPEAGSPHHVAKLYYRAISQLQLDQFKERFGELEIIMDGIPFPMVGYSMDEITTVINIRDYLDKKLAGIQCYASQFGPKMPILQSGFDHIAASWFWQESFILADVNGAVPVITDGEKETDFFAGVI